uniref:Uncharacterized protein n=1 Tax=Octopus bimaculoides TaxID=37653 RepID=A0A0L8I1G5_OCTBM
MRLRKKILILDSQESLLSSTRLSMTISDKKNTKTSINSKSRMFTRRSLINNRYE